MEVSNMKTKIEFTEREIELVKGDVELTVTVTNSEFDELIRVFHERMKAPLLRLIVVPPKGSTDGTATFKYDEKAKIIFENVEFS